MAKILSPDYYYDTVFDIDLNIFTECGVKGIIFDIDNTLVPYEIAEPTEQIRLLLKTLEEMGMKIAFVSNNDADRVELFNSKLGYFCFPNSHKPRRAACRNAMGKMGLTSKECAIVGDQVFTDVLCGHRAGLAMTVLVKPIKDKKTFLFKFKRTLERPILWNFKRKENKSIEK